MRRSSILLALLAISVVSAFPLAGEAFAQTETSLLESAETASMTTVVLTFTESVSDVEGADFTVDGAAVTTVSGASGETITLTIDDADAFGTDATPLVAFARSGTADGVTTTDDTDDKIQTRGSVRAVDGVAPTVTSAQVTGPNEITITYSEAVNGDISDYTNLRVGNPVTGGEPDRTDRTIVGDEYTARNIMDVIGFGSDTHTITFFGAAAATNALAQIDIGDVEDLTTKEDKNVFSGDSDNIPGQPNVDISDSQAPKVESVTVTGPNTVTVQWSEMVTTEAADYVNLRVDGPRNVTEIGPSPDSNVVTGNSVTLTFSGGEVSTSATGVITINPVTDTAAGGPTGNDNPNTSTSTRQSNIIVGDGQAPSLMVVDPDNDSTTDNDNVEGLKVTGPNTITLTANEAINEDKVTKDTFSSLSVDPDGAGDEPRGTREVTDVNVSGATVTITFDGDEVGTAATATIDIVDTGDDALVDVAGNVLTNLNTSDDTTPTPTTLQVEDGQAPTLVSIGITNGGNTSDVDGIIMAVFSEPVMVEETQSSRFDFSNFRIAGERSPRDIETVSGTNSATITITFETDLDGDSNTGSVIAEVRDTGTISIASTITDSAGTEPVDRNNFAGVNNQPVRAAQAPVVESIMITAPNMVTAVFSERLNPGTVGDNSFQDLRLRGEIEPRTIDTVTLVVGDDNRDGIDDNVVTIAFDTDGPDGLTGTDATEADDNPAPTDATATIDLTNTIAGFDNANHAAIPVSNMAVADGQNPELESISITGPNQVTAEFSEAVNAQRDHFEGLTIGAEGVPRNITGFTSTSTTYIMTFDGRAVGGDGAGDIDIKEGITDNAGNKYPGELPTEQTVPSLDNITVADGQAPTLVSIGITGPKTITAKFSESVNADSAGFVAFQVIQNGVPASDHRNISIDSNRTASPDVELTFSGEEAPLGSTGLINIIGGVADEAENKFAGMRNVPVAASQIPSVTSANLIGPGTVTVEFSEPVNIVSGPPVDNFTGLIIDGETEPRVILSAAGNGSSVATITFDTDGPDGLTGTDATSADDNPAPTDATATIDISGVTDMDDNVMGTVTDQPVGDKQNPTLNISVTGPNTVTAKFSEAVNAQQSHFTNLFIGSIERDITGFAASGNPGTYAITFGGAAVAADAAGTIEIGSGITDSSPQENPYQGGPNIQVTDGQAPVLLRAEFMAGNAIGFAYSEPVYSNAAAYTQLLFSTGSGDFRNVTSGVGNGQDRLIIVNYSGTPAGAGVTGTVSIDGINDGTAVGEGLKLAPITASISPKSAPTMVSAEITGPNEVTATFSEPVIADKSSFGDLRITGENRPRTVTDVAGSDTDTITITFAGNPVGSGATGTMDVNSITDLMEQDNSAISLQDSVINAGQNPSLRSATITGPNEITLTFSENVMFAAGVSPTDPFSNLLLFPGGPRNVTAAAVSGSTMTLTFDGGPAETPATATMAIGSGITDTQGNPLTGRTVAVEAGQAPMLTSVSISSDNSDNSAMATMGDTITLLFTASEPISMPDVTIHGSDADSVTNPAGTMWVATRTLQSGDTAGTVTFTIDFANLAGTAGTQVTATTDGSSVSFNASAMLDEATVTGPNEITVTFSRAVNADTTDFTDLVLVPGGARSVTAVAGSGTDTITLTFGGAAAATGAIATFTAGSGITDTTGIPFAEVSVTASDGQAPVLTSVTIASDNADSTTAEVGDTVTLTFTASEAVTGVTATIDGADGSPTSTDNITWTAAKTVTTTDLAGAAVVFAIDYTDMASIAGAQVTATTDGSSVTIAQDPANTATVTGTVFTDTNGNGVLDAGESGYAGYTMIAIDTVTDQTIMMDTAADGTYAFDSLNADTRILIQTGFFPAGHTVVDVASSWFTYVELAAGSTETFDVGFYPVPASEMTTLNLTVYHDENRNGMMDADESGIGGVDLVVYTYTIGPEVVRTDANGQVIKTDLVPADWAVTTIPTGYLPTAYSYERDDSTAGKVYDPATLVADDPAEGSTHTMMIGLLPAQ